MLTSSKGFVPSTIRLGRKLVYDTGLSKRLLRSATEESHITIQGTKS